MNLSKPPYIFKINQIQTIPQDLFTVSVDKSGVSNHLSFDIDDRFDVVLHIDQISPHSIRLQYFGRHTVPE